MLYIRCLILRNFTCRYCFFLRPHDGLGQKQNDLEHIAKIVFEREIGPPNTLITLDTMINQLTKDSDSVPANILALMKSVKPWETQAHTFQIFIRRVVL